MSGKVHEAINWQTVNDIHQLEHKRVIIRTSNGSVIDTHSYKFEHVCELIDPDQYLLHIQACEGTLDQFIIMFINLRSGKRTLNPAIKEIHFFNDLLIH